MRKNTGKKSEELFDEAFARLGKHAYVYTFTDASKATGRNRRVTVIDAQPSDRIVVMCGRTEFAEIKSTVEERLFPFSLLRKTQSAFAKMILAAGGNYTCYVHSLHHDLWFRIPYGVIDEVKAQGRASIPWAELSPYAWSLPCTPM